MIELERLCTSCGGKGELKYEADGSYGQMGDCARCDGHGQVLTQLGAAILDLVRRRLRLKMNPIDGDLIGSGEIWSDEETLKEDK